MGRIGGDNDCVLDINGRTGYYSFLNYTRDIRVVSYDAASGNLVVNALERGTGKYIGKFVGTLDGYGYRGKFTNYKGVSITFDLEGVGD